MSVTAVPLQPVKRSYIVWLWLGVIAAIALAVLLAWQGTRPAVAQHLPADQDAKYLEWHASQPGVQTTESGLQYMVLDGGRGGSPKPGDIALIGFEGKLRDGSIFQPRQAAQGWRIGDGIPGFDEALTHMTKGSRYRFWLPPSLAYGANPPPGSRIPPNSMLIFDIEMQDFISEAEIRAMQQQQMMQQQMMGGEGALGGPGAPGGEGAAPPADGTMPPQGESPQQ